MTTTTPAAALRRHRNHALWAGPLLTFGGMTTYFMFFVRFPALRDVPWLNLPIVWLGLYLSGLGVWRAFGRPASYRGKILGPLGLLFSLAVGLLFNLYIFSLSYKLPEPSAATLALDAAPGFSLPDEQGRLVDLEDLRGRKVVLVFYRGHW